ncbi:hypothetical protein BD626DRAFT_397094 [Schizophyllum amplum]|uniref:Cation efflux family-domain-containing protein n=1 Tax=Schizophyllum amplum TaxID=97359 RepID=A0A550CQQ6_9AGAR|nr:hypothetical protein BD626DRAFT_397094 [Auriculariopsis ampla]
MTSSASNPEPTSPISPTQSRRHGRMHSRNLSVFFPRPGTLSHDSTIEEDGTGSADAPVSTIPSADAAYSLPSAARSARAPTTPLGANFTFGGRPPATNAPQPPAMSKSLSGGTSSRRGHHHKHSLSHNFFSFLEPGAVNGLKHTEELAPPLSPWSTSSSAGVSATSTPAPAPPPALLVEDTGGALLGAAAIATAQFVLGAWLWVAGQQVGSLACTGLGYWIVFDAFGVAIENVLAPKLRARGSGKQRFYGDSRVETVAMFAQAVYLMFAAVYVCKETVEHLLLSAEGSSEQGHHHHHSIDEDDVIQIEFPLFLPILALTSLLTTASLFNNHSKLLDITGNVIPSPASLIRSLSARSSVTAASRYTANQPATPLAQVLRNPYIISPIVFTALLLLVAIVVPGAQHMTCDLFLAFFIASVTMRVAYTACAALGAVLLQTAPARGLPGGRMEAFLRVMRELERHPQILHLPAPRFWQLTPAPALGGAPGEGLVVTMELHVREDLPDEEVLQLTRWAWERTVSALGGGRGKEAEGPDVTVGVIRG